MYIVHSVSFMYKHMLVTMCITVWLVNILYKLQSEKSSMKKNSYYLSELRTYPIFFLAFERYPMTNLFSELSLSVFFCHLLLLQLLNLDYILPLLLPRFSLQAIHLWLHILQAGFLLGQWSLQLLNMILQGTVGLNQSCNNSIFLTNIQEVILQVKNSMSFEYTVYI